MTRAFLDALRERVLVCDGAMGTVLYGRGIFLNRCFDELNLTHPSLVADVHDAYVRAGADVIETNTFGANRVKLGTFGLSADVHAINLAGATIARRAAGDRVFVAGAMGPLGVRLEPWGRTGVAEAEAVFSEQAAALAEGGADLFILETFRDANELVAAIRGVRAVSRLPIVAQMTTEDDGNSLDGTPPETFAPMLEAAGADVIGVNCSVGPAAMLETVERMAGLTTCLLSAQPNAGRPRDVDGRNLYLGSPEYLASYARRFIAAGVRMVGGCCGTTPEHTRLIAKAVRQEHPVATPARHAPDVSPAVELPAAARADKSPLGRLLAAHTSVLVGEASAPRGLDLVTATAHAKALKTAGVAAVSVPDYPRNGARVSALALALHIQREAGLDAILHVSCRDRNLMGLQSDLLGAHTLGIRNVLLTTGDPAPQSAYADATSGFDVDAIGLINMATRLNHGRDIGGQSIGERTEFHIGAAVNPFAPDPDAEWRRLEFKVEAGAEYLLTPPIFDLAAFDQVWPRLEATGLPVITAVVAVESARQVEFHASEVTGVRLPDGLLEALRASGDEAQAGFAWALGMAEQLRARSQGVRVSALHGSVETAHRLCGLLAGRTEGIVQR